MKNETRRVSAELVTMNAYGDNTYKNIIVDVCVDKWVKINAGDYYYSDAVGVVFYCSESNVEGVNYSANCYKVESCSEKLYDYKNRRYMPAMQAKVVNIDIQHGTAYIDFLGSIDSTEEYIYV